MTQDGTAKSAPTLGSIPTEDVLMDMPIRHEFAIRALAGLLANRDFRPCVGSKPLAEVAVDYADDLLRRLEKKCTREEEWTAAIYEELNGVAGLTAHNAHYGTMAVFSMLKRKGVV